MKLSHGVLSKRYHSICWIIGLGTPKLPEREVQRFTGISIDRAIAAMEEDMQGEERCMLSPKLRRNPSIVAESFCNSHILDGIIDFETKELLASSIFLPAILIFVVSYT